MITRDEAIATWAHPDPPRALCSVCSQIDLHKITPPHSLALHSTLEELAGCSDRCFVCHLACLALLEKERILGKGWFGHGLEHAYRAELTLSTSATHLTVTLLKLTSSSSDAESWDVISGKPDYTMADVFTDEGDPVADILPWIRQVGQHTGSQRTIELARSWIFDCLAGRCQTSDSSNRNAGYGHSVGTPGSNIRPTRLVQIAGDATSLTLVDSDKAAASYVALSYVWGRQEAPWKTTRAKLQERERGFDAECLPRSLQDAVRVTHDLGYHLLWIDCLCIVQDDMDEWSKDAAKMASTFQNAVVTILADCSDDSTKGFLNSQSNSIMESTPHMRVTNNLADDSRSTLYITPFDFTGRDAEFDDSWNSAPSTRGWCCQERAASPRVLHFCEGQLHRECMHCSLAEDNVPRRYPRQGIADIVFDDGTTETTHERWVKAWYGELIGKDYRSRELTYPRDKLNAIAGIAALFHKSRPSGYYAGHWEDGFLESLCWYRLDLDNGLPECEGRKDFAYRAPTWSWASRELFYHWDWWIFGDMFEPMAEVVSLRTDVNPLNPFGEVKGGFLRLRAPTLRGRIAPASEGRFAFEFESGVAHFAYPDYNELLDCEIIACLLGVVDLGWEDGLLGHSLLLQQTGSSCRRVGMATMIHAADSISAPPTYTRAPDYSRIAPMEEFTII